MSVSSLHTAAVIGPGLLGGSIAMALRRRSPHTRIRIWARRQSAVDEVIARALCDQATTSLRDACEGADFIVLCTPMPAMPDLAAQIAAASLGKDCVVTDVGSAKTRITAALENAFNKSPASYIGSHPMAGSDKAGLDASRPDLFEGTVSILTPTLFTAEAALQGARAFWQLLGCQILEMPPEEHDRKTARISHMPHLCAAAITRAALRHDSSAGDCAGNGFRDTTRIAAGDPSMWSGIAMQNREEILSALTDARDSLSDLVAMLQNIDEKALHSFLAEAKGLRDKVPEKASPCHPS